MITLKKGDYVRVRRDSGDDWCDAYVLVASENGRSLGLLLASLVRAGTGMIGGALPVLVETAGNDQARFIGLTGDEYQIELLEGKETVH